MTRIWTGYIRGVEWLAVLGTAVLLVVAVLQVFFRYVVGASLSWSEELMRYLMVWITALGAGLAYTRGELLGMRMLIEAFPAPITRLFDLLGAVLAAIFCGAIAWHGWDFASRTAAAHSPALELGMFWVHFTVALAAALLLLHVALGGILNLPCARMQLDRSPLEDLDP